MLSRFTMSCCVADAFPYRHAGQRGPDAAGDFETGIWVRVSGELTAAEFAGDYMPVLFADTIAEVDVPQQPYLYP